MPRVRMRERNQLTIPKAITEAAGLQPNDALDVTYVNGVIIIVPVRKAAKKFSIKEFVGSAKGIYGKTAEDIDQYILNERDSWER